jgi:hypothetical protein
MGVSLKVAQTIHQTFMPGKDGPEPRKGGPEWFFPERIRISRPFNQPFGYSGSKGVSFVGINVLKKVTIKPSFIFPVNFKRSPIAILCIH